MEKKYLNELKLAKEFLKIAKENLSKSLRTSANRLYFSLEKAVTAYLIFKKMQIPKNHQKLWELAADLLGEEYYSGLRKLYDLRMQADYGNVSVFADLSVKNVKKWLAETEAFVSKLESFIK